MATKTAIIEKEKKATKASVSGGYLYAVGRRKTAVAQVRLYPDKGNDKHVVNRKDYTEYFPVALQPTLLAPLSALGLSGDFVVSATVKGGGVNAQAEAIRLGVARALLKHDEALRLPLRAEGLLTRDARSVERKKPGLKKARRSPQWSKR
ncbi:MAG: 30S ribosomal protein S9 [Candidatus Moranbacteria bacterium]|nr:30S ribosomal protein S9 [Candidatus Moranbacteria bacterium]NTW46217.1 30S ribosomal protein S9 [Candidatus Moranbacteria bacterium]